MLSMRPECKRNRPGTELSDPVGSKGLGHFERCSNREGVEPIECEVKKKVHMEAGSVRVNS